MPAKRRAPRKQNPGELKSGSGPARLVHDYTYNEIGRILTIRFGLPPDAGSDTGKAGGTLTFGDDGRITSVTRRSYYGLVRTGREHRSRTAGPANEVTVAYTFSPLRTHDAPA